MTSRRSLLSFFTSLAVVCGFAGTVSAQDSHWTWPEAAVGRALSYIRLSPHDLRLRADYVKRDACRLAAVDAVMTDPASMPRFLQDAAEVVFRPADASGTTGYSVPLTKLAVQGLGSLDGGSVLPPRVTSEFAGWPLDSAWLAYVEVVLGLAQTGGWPTDILGDLAESDRRLVLDQLPHLILEDVADKDKTEEALDALQAHEDSIAARFAAIAEEIDWRRVATGNIKSLEGVINSYMSLPPPVRVDTERGAHLVSFETAVGLVIIGTEGPDTYTGRAVIVIDPGGDDFYRLEPQQPGESRLIVDWSGNDDYTADAGYDLGSGFFSWGCLIDRTGNDLYRAGNFTLGSGWFGAGLLLDMAGQDTYLGDTYTQGAGGFGLGLLLDLGSQADQYTGRLFSQGMGFTAGVGVLADAGGNDVYVAGGLYEDILRYRDHFLSLSQGFGYGIRPHFSGGVGLLLDYSGNDVYSADIFGQGCSYWWGFGGLYDRSGNDQYVAYQYAQGSATHLTAGCLLDGAGDDAYFSKGVSQGCGHDWAAGILIDAAGNDRYNATDLSQAAGSANGVGIVIDGDGADIYAVTADHNTQGYGNPRREYGSVGLFLDLAGADRYAGPGRDGTVWLGNSRWGVGVDADSTWFNLAQPERAGDQ